MGAFDSIIVNSELLPVSDIKKLFLKNAIFQTKNFDCLDDTYYITLDGKLQREFCDLEEVPPKERPYPNPKHKLHNVGSLKKVNCTYKDIDFHGILIFYQSISHEWYEFNAKFTDGKLVSIARI